MHWLTISFALAFGLLTAASPATGTKRAICTPFAEGWEMIDDSIAINKAIVDCGNGGTIVLPADQIYSIRSQLDFTPCKNCDFQLEGQFLISRDEWTYWNSVGSIIKVAGVNGAKIRSLTGKGFIDGNAIDYYYRERWQFIAPAGPHFLHVTNGSSNILVDNLTIKNVPMRFFRADGNSTKLTYSRLSLSVIEQWGGAPSSESETFGFEMGDVSNVVIDTVSMNFLARGPKRGGPPGGGIGVCAAFDKGTNGVTVKNILCQKSWGGVGVMVGTSSQSALYENDGRPNTPQVSNGRGVSNIHVSNLTFDGGWATGYMNMLELEPERISNITWDGVTVLGGDAAVGDRCYLRCHCQTGHYAQCAKSDWKVAFENIRFENFKGAIGSRPGAGWGCATNQTLCDIQFNGWTSNTT
ncbi:glycoside hydrolase family 28 protein [Melanomma pulvis-pyrius CBS 109.77]|uniref:Glycoside hydrolase family 28 protein n=1 Tax=Melanomma pulvis-pyrius CBS 109.77 TaxID=1314802 RepID=A0A6A6XWS0_9PLEO|nr:glycoside hydrolase family 28 protein [Melanomma pulvis-pyrius CBS 109.77]